MDEKTFAPLAERMRPNTLDEFIGQKHLIYPDSFLVRAISSGTLNSCIFYGPPGSGKTTLANIIAHTSNGIFKRLNAVSSGVGEAKEIISQARSDMQMYGKRTYLLLDECHRWSKSQSDSVLQAIEDGSIVFIGSTTENPFISMTRAIVSRCKVFEFRPLTTDDVLVALRRALTDPRGYGGQKVDCSDEILKYIASISGGDIRSALNTLEMAVNTTPMDKNDVVVVTKQIVSACVQNSMVGMDESTFYDNLSAFCKSLRGSDTDAALYYCQKLLASGCDPRIIARRLIAHSSEDIGMADSNALLMSTMALNSCEKVGMPECNLTLAHAIIYVCEAEKSNSVLNAMHAADDDARNHPEATVPNHLKNHPTGYSDGHKKYLYPHNFGGYVKQQYLPDVLKDRVYYVPGKNGKEANLKRKKDKFK